jgi:hypothetical protein
MISDLLSAEDFFLNIHFAAAARGNHTTCPSLSMFLFPEG